MLRKIFAIMFIISSVLMAQENTDLLTGSLYIDTEIAFQETKDSLENQPLQSRDYKSPILSGAMSAVLPGAGQFYNKDYWKTALFLAIEAAAITIGVVNDNKGDEQTEKFESIANERWDAGKYARWTIDNMDEHLESVIGHGHSSSEYTDLFLDEDRTVVNWEALNRMERDIGGWYSHQLEIYGEQQYYEMIGKYPQFNPGWDDFDENSSFTYTNEHQDPVTPHFDDYSGERGKANDYYNIASTAVTIVVINHIISAVEAAWSSSRYNKKLAMNVSLENQMVGLREIYYPQLNIKLNL